LTSVSAKQLDLIMGFYPRLESKSTAVLGIDIAMIGFLAINAPNFNLWTWPVLTSGLALFFLAVSIYYVYVSSFPNLAGGHDSLIYFREIAKRTESQFISQFAARSAIEHDNDILAQVWRNSEILRRKFDAIKLAHIWLAVSIVPWIASLFIFAAINKGALVH
jgi:hypothetical protein